MKAQISVTETLLIVGSIAISSLLFLSLVDEVKEWSYLLTLSSAESVAKDIASLISISGASPVNVTVYYQLPEAFNISVEGRFVNTTLSKEVPFGEGVIKAENASAKITVNALAEIENVKKIKIEKTVEEGKNVYKVRKVE